VRLFLRTASVTDCFAKRIFLVSTLSKKTRGSVVSLRLVIQCDRAKIDLDNQSHMLQNG
jgi:hypothetical protein